MCRYEWPRAAVCFVLGLLFLGVAGCDDAPVSPEEGSSLTVDVEIVSRDTEVMVTVDGPDGLEAAITESRTFSDVALGEYVIRADTVQEGSESWYPTAPEHAATVDAGTSAEVTVRYAHVPIEGEFVPELDEAEGALLRWMERRSVEAGAFAVMRNRRVVLSRAYGWYDAERTTPLDTEATFRLASVTKPMTRAAIYKLIREGHLDLDTKAFPFLDMTPLPEGTSMADERLNVITIEHLLDHYGGWDLEGSNPLARDVSEELGLNRPPSTEEVVRWAMGQPLQHYPGTNRQYSNLGYWVLGLVVEKASGRSFVEYIQQEIMSPAFQDEVILARTRPEDRDQREPWYSEPGEGCSVFVITSCEMISLADGGRYFYENRLSGGGLAGSAPGVLDFLNNYWTDGQVRSGMPRSLGSYGRLPGARTLARQHADGFDYVVLLNQRTDLSGLSYNDFHEMIDKELQAIHNWP